MLGLKSQMNCARVDRVIRVVHTPHTVRDVTLVIVDTQNPSLILEIVYGGPYEWDTHVYWDGQDCPSALKVRCLGDLDRDGDVDLADLAAMLSDYGTPSGATFADGDMDNDGDVDLSDLALLLANYGPGCGP